MVWAFRTLYYDSAVDETLFFHDEFLVAATATETRSYPALAGQRISIFVNQKSLPQWSNNTQRQKAVEITYPGGIPTVAVTHPYSTVDVTYTEITVTVVTVGGS